MQPQRKSTAHGTDPNSTVDERDSQQSERLHKGEDMGSHAAQVMQPRQEYGGFSTLLPSQDDASYNEPRHTPHPNEQTTDSSRTPRLLFSRSENGLGGTGFQSVEFVSGSSSFTFPMDLKPFKNSQHASARVVPSPAVYNNTTPKVIGGISFGLNAAEVKESGGSRENSESSLNLQRRSREKEPESTPESSEEISIFDVLRTRNNNDSKLGSNALTAGPTSPSEMTQVAMSRNPTPNIGFPAQRNSTDSQEKPATAQLSESGAKTGLISPSEASKGPSSRTSTAGPGITNEETPVGARERSETRSAVSPSPSDPLNLSSLSALLPNVEAAILPPPPLQGSPFLSEPRSRPNSPSPENHPQTDTSCVYPPRNSRATTRVITKILKEDITGSIYIFEAPKFFTQFPPAAERQEAWVKIGVTSDIEGRRKWLSSRCGISDLTEVYASDTIRMDVLRVIEAVCHEQLNNFRRKMDCKTYGLGGKCDTMHNEWFAVRKEVAVRTVEMWIAFLEHNPYGDGGVLDERWRKNLPDSKMYRLLDYGGLEEGEILHNGLQAWIKKTAKGIRA